MPIKEPKLQTAQNRKNYKIFFAQKKIADKEELMIMEEIT